MIDQDFGFPWKTFSCADGGARANCSIGNVFLEFPFRSTAAHGAAQGAAYWFRPEADTTCPCGLSPITVCRIGAK